MFLGAVITALPLYIAAFIKHDSIGGADIKFMAASGFILGAGKGLTSLIVGLFVSIVFILIYRKLKRLSTEMAFPLIPFLTIGNIIAFIT
jgi:leader peptidase (prepilin peptidase)/N-methyltransferase